VLKKIILVQLCISLHNFIFCQEHQDSTAGRRHLLVVPIISRSIETSWSFGVAGSSTFHISRKDTMARTSNLQVLANYSVRKQFLVAADGTSYFPGEKYILSEHISYSYFPDKFWGLGPETADSNEENYKFKQFYIYLHGRMHLHGRVFLGLLYEFQKVMDFDYKAGGFFDKDDIPGRSGYFISGLGLSLSFDNRNHAFIPTRGGVVELAFNHFDPVIGSSYRYTNFSVDARKFWRIYHRQVLAAQFYGFFNSGDVPIRSLASLGGSNSMRGYYEGRYTDKNEMALQAEYRMPLYRRWGAVIFSSMGDVAHRLADFHIFDMKFSYGGGLRFAVNRKEKMNVRFDYGFGRGRSSGYYLQFSEAF
jgi:outer membrane protein assembly factor BamA